jgi:peptidoglycan/LPS O-acetylase OafA/YrhL
LNDTGIERFFWVDVLRGVAALVIVVFHYHHFYLADAFDRAGVPALESFPYAAVLAPLYSAVAAKAVEVFWLISGFVFAHVYMRRPVTGWNFFVARFARLYPLHFATLLYVAALQIWSLQGAGHWQIYRQQ